MKTSGKSHGAANARIIGVLCALVVGMILVAGLWPFHAPENHVAWLQQPDGLDFERHGSAVSAGVFPAGVGDATGGSMEIWLQSDVLRGTHAILSFYGSAHAGVPFALRQNRDGLVISRHDDDRQGVSRDSWIKVKGIFAGQRPVFVTITLEPHATRVYLDGVPAGSFPIYGTSANNFTGRLVLANSPVANNSWSGQIRGLAIYGRQLTPAQIVEHYESWTRNQRPALAEEEVPVALYAFHEHGGDRAHNQWNSATDLVIPPRYFVLHPGFLKSPWREYQPGWDYWEDVGVNVAGFIPLGFCVVAYLAAVRGNKRPATAAILVGLATSLTIELLQALLPTRESGMTDLMTNTLGTAIGVGLYRWPFTQRMLSGAGLGAQAAESSSEPSSGSPAEPAREFARVPADSAKLETSVSL